MYILMYTNLPGSTTAGLPLSRRAWRSYPQVLLTGSITVQSDILAWIPSSPSHARALLVDKPLCSLYFGNEGLFEGSAA